MIRHVKSWLRSIFYWMRWDITQNMKYDRLTEKIISTTLNGSLSGIDVGCHKGEIFRHFIRSAPFAKHYGFEPLPHLYAILQQQFGHYHNIYPYALSDSIGHQSFQYVENAPAYSGLRKRTYDIKNPKIKEIEVDLVTLDSIIGEDIQNVKLLKIDVEGAEYFVIKGALRLIARCKPIILFEFGKGASDAYDVTPQMMYELIHKADYNIYTLNDYVFQKPPLDIALLSDFYHEEMEYFYVAVPKII